ncbi:MAG: cytochrome ubiquinol oxidase subunit I [Marinilabiliales bacterium]
MEYIDLSLVDWSRGQFALTAMFHWIFVPLTLGLTFIIAIMETIYVRTGNPEWKRITKFWMKLFGINFAIGVATGIILEFEFGTNWSNYSWFVGDIFGTPLAVEGIMAFFLESTFIAIMFFGWNKVSKKFHLLSTWLVAIGSNLSALWILVANGWMQFPTGMEFNPDTARNEMVSFWQVLFSPVAINKFLHTITSAYVLSGIFVLGVSSWFILKKREILFAKRSIIIAASFGLLSAIFLAVTGDGSAYQVAQKQPVKLAAMEGLYKGKEGAGLIVFSILDDKNKSHTMKMEVPKLLSFLGYRDFDAFVPGLDDLVYGNEKYGLISADEKIKKGKIAINALAEYKKAKESGNVDEAKNQLNILRENFKYFGYGYLQKPEDIIPNVPLVFYSFHGMVALGFYFILLFFVFFVATIRNKIEKRKWWMRLAIISVPLVYLAQQFGWIVAEVGRQPWVIQDLMPTVAAVSRLDTSIVQITFWLFLAVFSILLLAELKIMFRQIKIGPKEEGGK